MGLFLFIGILATQLTLHQPPVVRTLSHMWQLDIWHVTSEKGICALSIFNQLKIKQLPEMEASCPGY